MSRAISSFTLAVALFAGAAAFASSGHRYVTDCNKIKDRPSSITITCGDANAAAIDLHWDMFGGTKAHGSGKFAYNDCKPSCAAGSGKTVPAAITLRGAKSCGSKTVYHEMIVHFLHTVPKGYRRYEPFLLGCPTG